MRACHLLLIIAVLAAPAFADRPVARWDTIPDQRVSSAFKVGVVAFHPDGVKVEFRVNGTLVSTANNPTLNDRTDVWEHWFSFDPSNYSDGAVTIDARAIPLNGTDPSYDLGSRTLYANSGGSLSVSTVKWADSVNGNDSNAGTESQPYKTLAKAVQNTPDGGTVYLKAGTYSGDNINGGNDRIYWTTVSAASGLDYDDVEITSGYPKTDRLRLVNVAIFTTSTSGAWTTILNGEGSSVGNVIWLDNVKAWNKNGRYAASTSVLGNSYGAYVTGGVTTQTCNGPAGSIVRGHHVQTITSDVFTGEKRLVVNCTVDDVDKGDTSAHPDFHQSYAVAPDWCEDAVLYNVEGYNISAQGLFGSRLRNSAFVNVLIDKVPGTSFYTQYSGENYNNLYFHCTIYGQTWLWRGADFDADNIKVYNCVLQKMATYESPDTSGLDIDTNHFVSTSMGTNFTTGDAMYADEANKDFSLLSSSPAYGTGKYLQCVPADVDGVAFSTNGRNKGCYAAGGTPSNQAPVANAGVNQTVTDADDSGAESVTLDGSGSYDSDGTISSYAWTESSTQIATGVSPSVSFSVASHTVVLTVTDDDSATGTDTVIITVNAPAGPQAPVADAGADQIVTDSDDSGAENVTLDGSGSYDPDGTITSYVWEENSSQIATGVSPTVSMSVNAHTVTLTVTDNDSDTDTDTVTITVNGPVSGQTYTVNGNTADTTVKDQGTADYAGNSTLRVGGSAADVDSCVVYVFELPTLGAGETVSDANVAIHLYRIVNNPGGAVDMYGLGYRSTSSVLGTDFYQGTYDGDTTDAWAIQNDFMDDTTSDDTVVSTDSAGDSALASYLAAQYAAGAAGGDFVFIRINCDIADVANYNYWETTSANSTPVPVLTITTGAATNQAPTADAGADQTVSDADDSGAENVTLDGSGSSDSDGTISSYVWEESSTQIATGVSPTVSLAVGAHTIGLTVTDDDSDTDSDTMVATVTAYVNVAPIANAGVDQTVSDADDSGAENVTLDGSGSADSDGTISSYVWEESSTQIATGVAPTVSLAVGAHTIDLTVTDDDSATDTDSVIVTVAAYVNVAPVADAGVNQTVTDTDDGGDESVTLDGSGSTDSDGTISSYVWKENSTQIATGSGPSVTLDVGVHTIELTVTDNDSATDTDTVTITVNAAPTGGSTYTVNGNTADNAVTQTGGVSWDGQSTLRVGGSASGVDSCAVFVFELPTLGAGETVSDANVAIHLYRIANSPGGAVDMYGLGYRSSSAVVGTDFYQGSYDGDSTDAWAIQNDFMDDATSDDTVVSTDSSGDSSLASYLAAQYTAGAASGDYVFIRLNCDIADVGNYHYWEVTTANSTPVPVLTIETSGGASNEIPTADAGADQIVADIDDSGAENVTLDGSGSSDSDGTIVSYIWEENSTQIASVVSPVVSFSVGGHTVVLTVTDDDDDTDTDSVSITVTAAPANVAPTADAGADRTVNDADDSGAENVMLDGSASSDSDGTIANYVWTESSTQIATGATPTVSLAVGSHTITLTVTDDDSDTDSDSMVATVTAYINIAPTADAGADQTVNDADDSGAENVTLDGSGSSDSDGTISSYVWEESSTQIATGVSPTVSLAVGSHTIDLTVTDDDSATDTDSMVATVTAYVNVAPTADAGADQTVTDIDDGGDESVTLDGSGSSDSDGTISSYVWEENSTQIATGSGPSVKLDVGVHTIELTVTDNDSATDTDTVTITVNAAPTGGSTYTVNGNTADTTVNDQGAVSYAGGSTFRVGGSGSGVDSCAVYVFELPTLGAGETVSDANVAIHLYRIANTPGGAVDMYGLGYRSTSSVLGTDFYQGSYDGDSTDAWAIQDDFMDDLTSDDTVVSTDSSGDAALASYLAAQYTAGAAGGDFVFIRINCDIADVGNYNYWETTSANSTPVPVLTIETNGGATNVAPSADAGPDQTVTDTDDSGAESVTLDGSSSSDSDGTISSYVWEENSSQIATGSGPSVSLAVGSHTIDLTVTDDDSATDTDSLLVTVNAAVANQAPTADAGADQTVTDSDGDGLASVTLDGSGSSDADGSISGYVWEEDASQIATGSGPSVTLDIGVYTIDLTVTDDDADTDTDSVQVTVVSRTLTSSTLSTDWPASDLPIQTGVFTVEYDAVPHAAGIDGVTGLSDGAGAWWSELACIVRFNTSNQIDVRDGGAYIADTTVSYTASTNYHFRLVVDVPNATYSVYVTPDGGSETTLATDYGFRTEQASITSIDNWTLNATNSVGTHTVSNLTITD